MKFFIQMPTFGGCNGSSYSQLYIVLPPPTLSLFFSFFFFFHTLLSLSFSLFILFLFLFLHFRFLFSTSLIYTFSFNFSREFFVRKFRYPLVIYFSKLRVLNWPSYPQCLEPLRQGILVLSPQQSLIPQ